MVAIDRPGTAWVTGASKGLGRALAAALARRGWTVVASGRDAGDLEALVQAAAGRGRILPSILDVTEPEAVAEAVASITRDVGPIDLAILNAGTHIPTPAATFDRAAVAKLVDTNIMGTVNCLAALLPSFRARRSGEIAVVASVNGYRGLPTAAAYGATKAAQINLCEALRPELELEGVSLRLISPGFVDTPLSRKNTFPMPFLMTSEQAAERILRGLAGRRFEIVTPWQMAILMKLLRILPYRLFFAITRRMTPTPESTRPE